VIFGHYIHHILEGWEAERFGRRIRIVEVCMCISIDASS